MSIDNEHELRSQLGAALGEFIPGPIPYSAVIRQGRAAVIRKRIAVAAALSVIAAGVIISTPVVIRQLSHRPLAAATAGRYHVTVSPPGPGSAKGLIAGGRINGRRWQATGQLQRTAGHPVVCIQAWGSSMSCSENGLPRASRAGDPADLTMGIGSRPLVTVGTVRADVAYLRLSLTNGQTLTLRPTAILGRSHASYVAFALPSSTAVTEIRAYSKRSELAYAVPFTARGRVETVRWLRPREPARLKPITYLIGSGQAGGRKWSEYAYVGPWGVCLEGAGSGGSCAPVGIGHLAGGQAARVLLVSGGADGTNFAVVVAAPTVSYVLVSRADGSTVRARTVPAGGMRFCTIASVPSDRAIRWTAYSAGGLRLASDAIP